jgi:hypothetical protein
VEMNDQSVFKVMSAAREQRALFLIASRYLSSLSSWKRHLRGSQQEKQEDSPPGLLQAS